MMNTLDRTDEKFRKDILDAARSGNPVIEIKDEDKYMDNILSIYTQINIHLNFVNPFKINKITATPLVTDGKLNSCGIIYKLSDEVMEKKYPMTDFDKILNDKVMEILIKRYNNFIKQLQNSDSEIYIENLVRTKKSILYLLKQAVIKFSNNQNRCKFTLSDKLSQDGAHIIKMTIKKNETIDLKVKRPHTVREKDFKEVILKAIRKMNSLMK